MAKKASAGAGLDYAERLAGTIYFIVYLLVMPLLAQRLFALIGAVLGTSLNAGTQSHVYYWFLFAGTLFVFHRFAASSGTRLFGALDASGGSLLVGLLIFYGANELLYRVLSITLGSRVNLNDAPVAALLGSAPPMNTLALVALLPFVEEMLFRGLVFGCIRERNRIAGYVISAALYALAQTWAFALSARTLADFALLAQYLVPGLVFAWVYDRSGTLWTSILLHAGVNALALWVILN